MKESVVSLREELMAVVVYMWVLFEGASVCVCVFERSCMRSPSCVHVFIQKGHTI